MSQHLHVSLTDEQRRELTDLIKKGKTAARIQNRARILLLADRSQGDKQTREQISQATGSCKLTVSNICRRFVQHGLDAALTERPRPGQTPKITGEVEAHLIALACSTPPEGQKHWTLKMLSEKLVELHLVDSISEVAIHQRLKKLPQALESQVLVHRSGLAALRSENGGRASGVRPSV